MSTAAPSGGTPFDDLGRYLAIPRVTGLRLSPDGSWLAAGVQTLAADGKKHVTSIWRIPAAPAGGESPRRLTRSADGESNPRFRPDGSVLFVAKRGGYDVEQPADGTGQPGADQAALWMLPAGGGEAVLVAALPGGVTAAEAAAGSGTIALTSPVLPGAGRGEGTSADGSGAAGPGVSTAEDDARLRKAREDAGVTAILHESVPVRYWDHDLGPAQLRLFLAGEAGPDTGPAAVSEEAGKTTAAAALRDLTPEPGRALDRQPFGLSPDGTAIATGWWRWEGAGDSRAELALIDVATATRRTLLSAPGFDYENPAISPDGQQVACIRSGHHGPEHPGDVTIVLAPVTGPAESGGPGDPGQPDEPGGGRDLLGGFDRRPAGLAWAPDSGSVYFTADDQGRRPVFRAGVATGEVVRVSADDGAYSDLCPAPDGRTLYALRSSVDEPPTPVRLDAAEGSKPVRLASPGSPVTVPGHLEEIGTTADDGTPIRSWLVLPETASAQAPAPLLLWVHGGPMMSWNAWSWRWNPWLMAARGYAVLLPDPALSTGYGHDFIERAYHEWGARPFADLMAATDGAVARPDIDGSRTAMMGGSYGGYMANWIAGHTGRFKAIVSHASLWMLDQMFGTTDLPMFWRPQFGDPLTSPERYEANSPHRHIADIRTPMLVIHGNRDYRVPVGEALRLWWDLNRHGAEAKFLYFPDENHWILSPGHAAVWYETVFAFLAHHVLGQPWRRPERL